MTDDAEPAVPEAVTRLFLLGRAYGLGARLFAPDGSGPTFGETLQELRGILERLGQVRAPDRSDLDADTDDGGEASGVGNDEALEEEYTRLFVKGEVPPYEASYEPLPVASKAPIGRGVQQIADAAGFYRAFGFQVDGERPDHLAAELEFASLLCVKEAYARLTHEDEGAEICRRARTAFLNEHLLAWLPQFHARVTASARHPSMARCSGLVLCLAEDDQRHLRGGPPGPS